MIKQKTQNKGQRPEADVGDILEIDDWKKFSRKFLELKWLY